MAYGRRYYKRRRYRRRRYNKYKNTWLGGKGTRYLGYAKKAFNVAMATKKLLNVEFKHNTDDNVSTPLTPDSVTGSLTLMTALSQGDDSDERNGRQVRAKRLVVSMRVLKNVASTVDTYVRYWFVKANREDLSTTPTLDEMLDDPTNLGTFALRNLKYTRELQVLKYGKIYLRAENDAGEQTKMQERTINLALNHKIKYIGTDATVNSMGWGNVYMIVQSSASSANAPTVYFNRRFTYLDN